MGLDITAYTRLRAVGRHTDGWCYEEGHINAFAYDCFPRSFRGIPVAATEVVGGGSMLLGGCYTPTDRTDRFDFEAGSYGGYGMWRDDLRAQFNPDTDPDGPFYELIWFADNEGCIGPEAADDLRRDFVTHVDRYRPPPEHGRWWVDKYKAWLNACKLAADAGLIRFH